MNGAEVLGMRIGGAGSAFFRLAFRSRLLFTPPSVTLTMFYHAFAVTFPT